MTSVVIYESHPAVLAGLQRRLEGEAAFDIRGAFGDPALFAQAVKSGTPDVAVIGAFGPGAIAAANRVSRSSPLSRIVVLAPGLRRHERMGYPPGVEFISDGPRGDVVVQRLLATQAPSEGSSGHIAS